MVIFGSAVLAGWLMGLLAWLVAAARETISQLVLVALVTWMIGFARLHHSIAVAWKHSLRCSSEERQFMTIFISSCQLRQGMPSAAWCS
jgi:formate/nitrite transporter FocA (FNT family)